VPGTGSTSARTQRAASGRPPGRPSGRPGGRRLRFGEPPSEGVSATQRVPFGWAPVVVLFLVGMVDRIETSVIAGVLPLIQAEWSVSDTWAGAIPTAAAIAGAVVALPAGYYADRVTRTRIIAVVVAVWSVITLGSAIAVSFAMFFVTRVALGAADNIDTPSVNSLLADYYPPAIRASVFGWARLTHYAGLAVGVILGGVIGEAFGWRAAFYVMVLPGLGVAWLCWRLREPIRGFLDQVVARGGDQPVPVPEAPAPIDVRPPGRELLQDAVRQVREVVRIPTLHLVCLGLTALSFGLGGIFYWLPSLLQRSFALGEARAGTVAGAIGLVGVVGGTLAGGWLGNRWHVSRTSGRLLAGGGGLVVGTLGLLVTLRASSLALFALLLAASFFAMSIAIPNLMASLADVVVATSRGVGFAVLSFLVTLGSAFGPLLVGAISDVTGSLLVGMYALTVPMLLGGVLVLRARRHFERDAGRVLADARGNGDTPTR
jgi:MFS family permease